jgi:hypothetical protein
MKTYPFINVTLNVTLLVACITTLACKAEEDPFSDFPSGGVDPEPLVVNEDYKNVVYLTREQRLQQRFTITVVESMDLVGVIDSSQATIETAKAANNGRLASSFITQAITLYLSLPRETTPVVGLSREIPASIVPYFNNPDEFVQAYEKELPVVASTNYIKMLVILSELNKDQLLDFVILISPKSVPAKVDCALYGFLTEFVKDNSLGVEASGVNNINNFIKWNELHNPIFRDLGMLLAPSVIADKTKLINFLDPYLAETDDLLVGGLINSYASIGNQAAKTKLLQVAALSGARGKLELQQKAIQAAKNIE